MPLVGGRKVGGRKVGGSKEGVLEMEGSVGMGAFSPSNYDMSTFGC